MAAENVERCYDADLVVETELSPEISGRLDVLLELRLTRRFPDGLTRRWPQFTFFYPNVEVPSVEKLKSIVLLVVEDITAAGVPTQFEDTDDPDGDLVFEFRGVDHDGIMVIQQMGIELIDDLGDLGFAVAAEKGLAFTKALEVKAKRGKGHYKEAKGMGKK